MKRHREDVQIRRPVRVERVPDGSPMELPAGALAQVTQALGSSFTLLVDGQLVRLKGADADAIGKPPPEIAPVPDTVGPDEVSSLVWQALKTCYDPEIPVDIVELGLVYRCDFEPMEDGQVRVLIDLTLTAPGCGMGETMADEVCDKVLAVPHVGEITVRLVFDPPWDRSRMSEAALLSLGL
ncbi:putative Fe-S cluster assembly protein SufT [Acidovorax sp. SRB_14]|uniref:putative Fe-S cluster assembly protein SufT n=1 Tax=unclassified Acidovorax TaxID=2684926 RepID=UPI00145D56D9|nr:MULTISPECIES: putative Fe-S cluster assembly protein SufT [unclassified Acidovorax]NMM79029.1 putative Fe-S cluster assembly protein SufT [Acidovorax sp. SRB_24]NMM79702.1 putative Fe-S cluster assembly protein SufT [Acidovorax sp. SRB_14]